MDVRFTVDLMAKKCGQSVSDFTRKFKKTTGLSPKAYLHNVLLNKSKVLLATTNKSVKEIAYSLGYKDSLYFSRFFSKYCGISPISYRKSQM
jgi:AraC-like DNA-binding protein